MSAMLGGIAKALLAATARRCCHCCYPIASRQMSNIIASAHRSSVSLHPHLPATIGMEGVEKSADLVLNPAPFYSEVSLFADNGA